MERVYVGLSGGVDSAVSAALLQREGYDVTGVFIKIWQPEFIECTWRTERLDAMRVCAALGIPFKEIDLSEEYKREVVESMLADYTAGKTPNPDVLCNKSIKFGAFLKWALQDGADKVATGHYARICRGEDGMQLLRGVDTGKDQSYFLHLLTQEQLEKTIFPVGGMQKKEVRVLAESFNLPVARKHDSQGLCFVGDVSMADFLRRFITVERGVVRDERGKEIGVHEGAALYTIGQRHGFVVTHAEAAKEPLYVAGVDTKKNTLTVSAKREAPTRTEISVTGLHWIGAALALPHSCEAQARYREAPVGVSVEKSGDTYGIRFEKPHVVSPGQSLVLYQGDVCLGGGVIV